MNKKWNEKTTLEKIADSKVSNLDLIFPNIILTDGTWNVIDYEWTFEAEVPLKFIIHRAIYLYCQSAKRKVLEEMGIYQMFGISKEEEDKFQDQLRKQRRH